MSHPSFNTGNPTAISRPGDWRLEFEGQDTVWYREGGRKLQLEHLGAPGEPVHFYIPEMSWAPPHDREPIPPDQARKIVDRVRTELTSRGWRFSNRHGGA